MALTYADPVSAEFRVRPRSLPEFKPRTMLGLSILKALPHLPEELAAEIVDRIKSVLVVETSLAVKVLRGNGFALRGLMPAAEVTVEDYGVVSRKVVTDVGVGYIVDAFQNSVELENMKFHSLGTGSTAENVGDTALVTELTTEYTGNVRATGTTTEGATANIYRTVATNTLDSGTNVVLREHGIHSASTAGVLFDRSVFAAITLSAGDSLQSTYEATFSSGG